MSSLTVMFHNQSDAPIRDTYGCAIPVGGSRHVACKCKVPCRTFKCPKCKERRAWCCGGSPAAECDHCWEGARRG